VDADEPDAFMDDLDGLYKDQCTLAVDAVFVNNSVLGKLWNFIFFEIGRRGYRFLRLSGAFRNGHGR
jgi:hypothetical protein